jgi:hypothetical protein
MFVSCTVFVLSGRGLCDGPIPRPEESYRLWCVSVCDLLWVGRRGKDYGVRWGRTKHEKKKSFELISEGMRLMELASTNQQQTISNLVQASERSKTCARWYINRLEVVNIITELISFYLVWYSDWEATSIFFGYSRKSCFTWRSELLKSPLSRENTASQFLIFITQF